jgi:hypothetical protein
MIRTLNIAFVFLTGFVCLGLYRIAEEARVTQADLRETQRAIVTEQNTLTVLGAEWARITQPARIQALASRHLELSDQPTVELSSLEQLPPKNPPLAPDSAFRNAKAVVPAPQTEAPPPAVAPAAPSFAVLKTGT